LASSLNPGSDSEKTSRVERSKGVGRIQAIDVIKLVLTSIPNRTTDLRASSPPRIVSTSGITMEKTVLSNTRAFPTSISETVLPKAEGGEQDD
jgi:hypothetical protein